MNEEHNSVPEDVDTGRCIVITWVDSGMAHLGWETPDKVLAEHMHVSTVQTLGYYVGENDMVVAVAQSKAENGDYCNVQVILKSCIEERAWLE